MVFHESRPLCFSRITKHETRITAFFRITAFPVARLVPVGTEALQSFFSAPAGIASGEKSRFSGLVMPSSMAQTKAMKARFTSPPALAGKATASRDQRFFTKHETRITNHGFFCTEALQSFFFAPAGIASGEKTGLSCIGIHHPWRERKQDSQARRRSLVEQPQATTNSFSRITKHETRITAFMFFTKHETRITNHGFLSPLMPCSPLFTIVHDCSRLFAIVQQKILSRQVSAHRPAFWLGLTTGLHVSSRGEVKCVSRAEEKARAVVLAKSPPSPLGTRNMRQGHSSSPALRHFFWSKPVLRPCFSRITSHESRITAFMFFTNHESGTHHQPPAGLYLLAARSPRSCALWCGCCAAMARHGRLWRGMGGILPLRKCPRSVRRSRWQPVVKPRVAPRAARIAQLMALCPADKERRGSILDIFDRGATQFRRDASPLNLHFSPRGAAKWVRGPSGRGASRAEEMARAVVLAKSPPSPLGSRNMRHGLSSSPALRHFFWSEPGPVDGFSRNTRHETRITAFLNHGLSGSTAIRHFFWSKPVLCPCFSRVTNHESRITALMFFTNHETRNTKHGLFLVCFTVGW